VKGADRAQRRDKADYASGAALPQTGKWGSPEKSPRSVEIDPLDPGARQAAGRNASALLRQARRGEK